jgi:hypothetical protein
VKVPLNPNCTASRAAVTDNYWADFLFGTTNNYSLGGAPSSGGSVPAPLNRALSNSV